MLDKDLKRMKESAQEPLRESIAAFLMAALATLVLILIMASMGLTIR